MYSIIVPTIQSIRRAEKHQVTKWISFSPIIFSPLNVVDDCVGAIPCGDDSEETKDSGLGRHCWLGGDGSTSDSDSGAAGSRGPSSSFLRGLFGFKISHPRNFSVVSFDGFTKGIMFSSLKLSGGRRGVLPSIEVSLKENAESSLVMLRSRRCILL